MYQRKIAVPHSIIEKVRKEDFVNSFCIWVRMKALYKNTVIYNLNYDELSRKIGVSHTSLRKHIRRLKGLGWVKMNGNHLHLIGINKLKKGDEGCVLVKFYKDIKRQRDEFKYIITRRNLVNQHSAINRKSEIVRKAESANGKLSKKELKAIQKAGGLEEFEKTMLNYTTISNKKFGELFGRSKYTGRRIQAKLKKLGLIKSKINLQYITTCSVAEYKYNWVELGGQYIYNYSNQRLYKRLSNKVDLLFPDSAPSSRNQKQALVCNQKV